MSRSSNARLNTAKSKPRSNKARSSKSAKANSAKSNKARSRSRSRSNSANPTSIKEQSSHVNINTRNLINANSGNKYNLAVSFCCGEVIPKLVDSFVIDKDTFSVDPVKFAYCLLEVQEIFNKQMEHNMRGVPLILTPITA